MTTLAYFLFDIDDQKNKPQDEIIEEAHEAEYWFADMASNVSIRALERPSFSELFKFARKGDTLVVSSIECLGRCSIELFETFQALQAKGVGVISVREDFDLSSPVGKAALLTLSAIVQVQRTVTGGQKRKGKK